MRILCQIYINARIHKNQAMIINNVLIYTTVLISIIIMFIVSCVMSILFFYIHSHVPKRLWCEFMLLWLCCDLLVLFLGIFGLCPLRLVQQVHNVICTFHANHNQELIQPI